MDEQAAAARRTTWGARGAQFIALLGFYRVLVGTDEGAEWVVGAIAAALATAATSSVAVQLPPWEIPPRGLVRVARLIPRIIAESLRVSLASLAQPIPAGTFAVIPVDKGGEDARSVGRRGLILTGASLAPNSVAVTLDRDHGYLLVHRLLASSQPQAPGGGDREWPL